MPKTATGFVPRVTSRKCDYQHSPDAQLNVQYESGRICLDVRRPALYARMPCGGQQRSFNAQLNARVCRGAALAVEKPHRVHVCHCSL